MFGDCRLIEALNDFVEKSGDDEALRGLLRNSPRTKIKHFILVDLSRGGAMCATNIVGKNFQTRH